MSRYRFPGLNAYSYEDAFIFKGRDEDSATLLMQIRLHKTLVLHAESGIGKSSLIQAGLLPLIEQSDEKLIPVIIRLTELQVRDSPSILLDFVIEQIHEATKFTGGKTFNILPPSGESLWMLNKLCERNGASLLLIFDQFENLQSFSKAQIETLKLGIFDLLNSKIPKELYGAIEAKLSSEDEEDHAQDLAEEYELLSAPSKAKALFVIREDKLGTMSLLCDLFPDILKNDFIIEPLSKAEAFKAIEEPAAIGGDFLSEQFSFEQRSILTGLIDKIVDKETQLVDPIQLQIVARDLERNVVMGQQKNVIREEDIPQVADIVNKFYFDCWDTVARHLELDDQELFEIRKKVVPKLVVNDRRDLVLDGRIPEGNPKKAMEVLRNEGLIREIISGSDNFYQLSHDRLIEPGKTDVLKIAERKKAEKAAAQKMEEVFAQQREERAKEMQQRKMLVRFGVIGFIAMLVIFVVFYNKTETSKFKLREERIIGIVRILRTTNPTFAYELLKDFSTSNSRETSPEFKNYLNYFETANYTFQTSSYPLDGPIVAVDRDSVQGSVTVIAGRSETTWDMSNTFILKQRKLAAGMFLDKKIIRGKATYLVENGDSIEVQDADGVVANKFYRSAGGDNIDISADGAYVVIGDNIHSTDVDRHFLATLPLPQDVAFAQQTTCILLNDSRHLVAAYSSGHKVIYKLPEADNGKISVTAILPPMQLSYPQQLKAIAIDSKDRFVYVGSSDKRIEVWRIDSLIARERNTAYFHPLSTVDTRGHYDSITASTLRPVKILEGHSEGVNTLCISPNDSFLLSSSDDNSAILWDCNTWKKVSILKSEASTVQYAGFMLNDKNLYTGTEEGMLFLWSRESASHLYDMGLLPNFSPLDYYNVRLGKDDEYISKIFDTARTVQYFANTLNYIINMPSTNLYPEDAEYLANLKASLASVKSMFLGVTQRKDFHQVISTENEKLLYKYYNALDEITPELLLHAKDEKEEDAATRLNKSYAHKVDELLIDTAANDIDAAIELSGRIRVDAHIFKTQSKYGAAIQSAESGKRLMEAFFVKFRSNDTLRIRLSRWYGMLSNYYLFATNTKAAARAAEKGLELGQGENQWIYTNLALVYLMEKQFKRAEDIYRVYKNKTYPNLPRKYKDIFMADLEELENAGVLSKDDPEMYTEVLKIKKFLTDK